MNPLYHSTILLKTKIEFCENEYQQQGLPVIFKLIHESCPQDIDKALEKRNYTRLDETSVRVLDLKQYKYRKPSEIVTEDAFNNEWLRDFFDCSNMDNQADQKNATGILNNITGAVIVVRKKVDGKTVGCGYGAIERGFIGIFDILIDKNYRGKGYGQDIMDGILSAAFEKGVHNAYLAVVVGNTPAENLYQKLGFKEIYRYWYRKK